MNKKYVHKHLDRVRDELVDIMHNEEHLTTEDRIFHEMLYNIELIRDAKFDLLELRLLNAALKELRHSMKIFKEYYRVPKAAVFGSARTPRLHADYKIAKQFGRELSKRNWMTITGGASGIMEAAMMGAGTSKSFGLNIQLPFEQDANRVILGNKKLMNFKYFFTRKLMFLKESAATVLFPGGFGTFDEGFESLTLIQTGKAKPRPVVFIDPPGSNYWRIILRGLRLTMEKSGMISPGDLSLIDHYQDAKEAAESIVKFYKNYQTSRFYYDRYLIYLKKKLTKPQLKRINQEFRSMLVPGGSFSRLKPSAKDSPKDRASERLIFPFNRRDYSRLKLLIDVLNTF